jgi:hypothetical protein
VTAEHRQKQMTPDSPKKSRLSVKAANPTLTAATPITPEVKAAIAEEVKQELANDNAHAANPSQASFDLLPSIVSKPNHVFIVSSDLRLPAASSSCTARMRSSSPVSSVGLEISSGATLSIFFVEKEHLFRVSLRHRKKERRKDLEAASRRDAAFLVSFRHQQRVEAVGSQRDTAGSTIITELLDTQRSEDQRRLPPAKT